MWPSMLLVNSGGLQKVLGSGNPWDWMDNLLDPEGRGSRSGRVPLGGVYTVQTPGNSRKVGPKGESGRREPRGVGLGFRKNLPEVKRLCIFQKVELKHFKLISANSNTREIKWCIWHIHWKHYDHLIVQNIIE